MKFILCCKDRPGGSVVGSVAMYSYRYAIVTTYEKCAQLEYSLHITPQLSADSTVVSEPHSAQSPVVGHVAAWA